MQDCEGLMRALSRSILMEVKEEREGKEDEGEEEEEEIAACRATLMYHLHMFARA